MRKASLLVLVLISFTFGCSRRLKIYEKPQWKEKDVGAKLVFGPKVEMWYAKAKVGDFFPNVPELQGKNRILVSDNSVLYTNRVNKKTIPGFTGKPSENPDWAHRDFYDYVPTEEREFEIVDSFAYYIFGKLLAWEYRSEFIAQYPLCYLQVKDSKGNLSFLNIGVTVFGHEGNEVSLALKDGEILPLQTAKTGGRYCGYPGEGHEKIIELK